MSQGQFPSTPAGAPGVQPHRGVLILVFSILSWVVCFIFGIVAWVMANKDLQAMDAGQMDREGQGLTKAGKIIAMIHVILCAILIPLYIIIMVFAGGLAIWGSSQGSP